MLTLRKLPELKRTAKWIKAAVPKGLISIYTTPSYGVIGHEFGQVVVRFDEMGPMSVFKAWIELQI